MEWIKVSERLPEPESFYLVHQTGRGTFLMYYGKAAENRYNWFYKDEEIKPYLQPTHWMPLPALPKEG